MPHRGVSLVGLLWWVRQTHLQTCVGTDVFSAGVWGAGNSEELGVLWGLSVLLGVSPASPSSSLRPP